jgi:uncharacterized membrane protein
VSDGMSASSIAPASAKPSGQPRGTAGSPNFAPLAAALTFAAIAWLALVLAAPVALARARLPVVPFAAYQIGSMVCHQRPERSFHLMGIQMPVCARCLGLYAAGAAGLAAGWFRRKRRTPETTRILLAVAALPIASTVALEWIGAIDTSNLARALTGLPLGAVAGTSAVESLRRMRSA